jgi:hypothetical protein
LLFIPKNLQEPTWGKRAFYDLIHMSETMVWKVLTVTLLLCSGKVKRPEKSTKQTSDVMD